MKAEEKKKRLEKQHEEMKKESEMISKQLGDSRDWRSDRRDIRDDRSRSFGIDPRSRVSQLSAHHFILWHFAHNGDHSFRPIFFFSATSQCCCDELHT